MNVESTGPVLSADSNGTRDPPVNEPARSSLSPRLREDRSEEADRGEAQLDENEGSTGEEDPGGYNPEEDPSPRKIIARKVYENLINFRGCSETEHQIRKSEHFSGDGLHFSLRTATSLEKNFPFVLDEKELLTAKKLDSLTQPNAEELRAAYCGIPTRRQLSQAVGASPSALWTAVLSGRDLDDESDDSTYIDSILGDAAPSPADSSEDEPRRPDPTDGEPGSGWTQPSTEPMHVCLDLEEHPDVANGSTFDVDSVLGFPTSLAFARTGLDVSLSPHIQGNIKTDVHLKASASRYATSADGDEERVPFQAELRRFANVVVGRVAHWEGVKVHALLPNVEFDGDHFNCLTGAQLERWCNMLIGAINAVVPPDVSQHLPGDHEHAHRNSHARQIEGRLTTTASYQSKQSLHYHIQSRYLDAVWNKLLEATNRAGYQDFRSPILFFSAKNLKLNFKGGSAGSALATTVDSFENTLDTYVDGAFIREGDLYVDIGKEICPAGGVPHVNLWRRCCLESYMDWMYDKKPPKRNTAGFQLYPTHMLDGVCSLTSCSPARSVQRKGGLVYTQMYASVKEMFDAAKVYPFSNRGIEELAVDDKVMSAVRSAAGGRHAETKVVLNAYRHSKQRSWRAMRSNRSKSYGLRMEYRVSWSLLREIRQIARDAPGAVDGDLGSSAALPRCPPCGLTVPTGRLLRFVEHTLNKFVFGFEMIRARHVATFIPWEKTKMLSVFLRCLRHFFGSGIPMAADFAVWCATRESRNPRQPAPWIGLGFSETLPKHGFCWIRDGIIDWTRLRFMHRLTDGVLFGISALRGRYRNIYDGSIGSLLGARQTTDEVMPWIDENLRENRNIVVRLLHLLASRCLKQFRIDVVTSMREDIQGDSYDDALRGNMRFTHRYLKSIMRPGAFRVVSGKQAMRQKPAEIFEWLFGEESVDCDRKWASKPFRLLYREMLQQLSQFDGRGWSISLKRCINTSDPTCSARTAGSKTFKSPAAFFRFIVHQRLLGEHWMLPHASGKMLVASNRSDPVFKPRLFVPIAPVHQLCVSSADIELLSPTCWKRCVSRMKDGWRPVFENDPPSLGTYYGDSWSYSQWETWIANERLLSSATRGAYSAAPQEPVDDTGAVESAELRRHLRSCAVDSGSVTRVQ